MNRSLVLVVALMHLLLKRRLVFKINFVWSLQVPPCPTSLPWLRVAAIEMRGSWCREPNCISISVHKTLLWWEFACVLNFSKGCTANNLAVWSFIPAEIETSCRYFRIVLLVILHLNFTGAQFKIGIRVATLLGVDRILLRMQRLQPSTQVVLVMMTSIFPELLLRRFPQPTLT
jgi:hypothetical protein